VGNITLKRFDPIARSYKIIRFFICFDFYYGTPSLQEKNKFNPKKRNAIKAKEVAELRAAKEVNTIRFRKRILSVNKFTLRSQY